MGDSGTGGRDGATVGAGDIARLAGVGRAAVSNWRRRFPDFPQPVGGSTASPLYALSDVEAWLTKHNRQFLLSPADDVWQRIRGAIDELRLADLVGLTGAFLVLLDQRPGVWKALSRQPDDAIAEALPGAIAAAVPQLGGALQARTEPEWVSILRLVAGAARDTSPAGLYDFVTARYHELLSRRLLITPDPLADTMVALAAVKGATVLDPACGTGTLLTAARAAGATGVYGQEINAAATRITAARLLLHGDPARLAAGDSLRDDAFAGERVDAVVCNPPFGERNWGYDDLTSDPRWEYGLPPRGESELAWIQHCLAHTAAGGRLVIVMPPGVASRRAGRRIRGNLLRAGVLRAVISVPGSGATIVPDLWVLHRPLPDEDPGSYLLVVDATTDLAIAERAWQAFLAKPDTATGDNYTVVRIIDLLDDEVDLTPTHWLARASGPADGSRFTRSRADLANAVRTLSSTLPNLAVAEDPGGGPRTTLGELARAGMLTMHQAPLRMSTDGGDIAVLTTSDLRRGRPPTGRTTMVAGGVEVRPGDVVVPLTAREPLVRVIEEGGYQLGPQLLLLRPDPDRLDPHYLAGFLRHSQEPAGSRASSLAPRSDIRRVELPRLPVADQRRYGAAFRQLATLADHLGQVAALGDTVIRAALAGLAEGGLTPPAEPGAPQ